MKLVYESPKMYGEVFVANQYVAACGDMQTIIPSMEVRCQSDGHYNTANDVIFMDSNDACIGKYNKNLTNDNCHSQWSHAGDRAYGTGFVNGTWGTKTTTDDDGQSYTGSWFYEAVNGLEQAFKGFFSQGGHRHLFYATTEQAEIFQAS
ncbi:MAG: hypothetical protein IJN79_09100 [Clostridia bacterium]|nr:hypothetical protein [Clostridia bacterium]